MVHSQGGFYLFVCFIFAFQHRMTDQFKLNDYILDFQPLAYDPLDLHAKHDRVKRSVDQQIHMSLSAYGRKFQLRLKRDTSVYSLDHRIVNDDGSLSPVDTSFVYSGYLEDTPRSYAHVAVINGTVRGFISLPDHTTYHIEPAEIYFQNPSFHTVIYPETHMNLDPYRHKRSIDLGGCGNDEAAAWLKKHSQAIIPEKLQSRAERYATGTTEDVKPHNKYSAESNSGGRHKRATIGEKNTCYLYLRADPILWEHIKNRKYHTTLSDERTQEEILAFFASHVSAVKNIYSKTEFHTYDESMKYIGVDFLVQRTSIMTLENQRCNNSPPGSNYCDRNIDVTNFLNLNSLDQHDEFCLAYVFTFRDFTKGTLGLAWVGSDSRAAGGVCERFKDYPEGGSRVSKSLNTGIVTVINYGKAVPPRVSQLTFAHEIGHNFGSPHDSGPTCAPYGTNNKEAEDGNYIMFASATMGDKPNNDDFSRCSLDNITRVLDAVINERYGKVNCFQRSTQAFCGNGIKEENEECDCGYDIDCKDICCYGKGSQFGKECTLRENKQCSPTAGPCCSATCEYIVESNKSVCQPADDCKAESICGGESAMCPSAKQIENGTFCNDFSQICLDGECVSSVCHKIQWEECFLTSGENNEGPTREAMCYVSCRNPKTKQCVSSYMMMDIDKDENSHFKELLKDIQRLKNNKGVSESNTLKGIQLPAGSPCDNFRGYCDVFHKCRGVDADGPLARLKNLIFNPKTLQSIKEWIVIHWWAMMLMCLAMIVVMSVFIKVCAVHTPSSNPNKPKARKLTMTLRRPHHHHRRNQPPGPQTAALTANEHGNSSLVISGRSENRVQGLGRSSEIVQPSIGMQGSKTVNNNANSVAPSSVGAAVGEGSAGAAAVVVEKFQDPPPPYSKALPTGSKLPPHGKGRRNKRREKGLELQRL